MTLGHNIWNYTLSQTSTSLQPSAYNRQALGYGGIHAYFRTSRQNKALYNLDMWDWLNVDVDQADQQNLDVIVVFIISDIEKVLEKYIKNKHK